MSEVSDAFHLYSDSRSEVEALIERVGWRSALVGAHAHWWTFLVDSPSNGTVDTCVAGHNRGLLVHHGYGGDHGLDLRVFDGNREIAYLSIQLEVDPLPALDPYDPDGPAFVDEACEHFLVLTPSEVPQLVADIHMRGERPVDPRVRDRPEDETLALLAERTARTMPSAAQLHGCSVRETKRTLFDALGLPLVAYSSTRDLGRAGSGREEELDFDWRLPERRHARSPRPNAFCTVEGQLPYLYLPVPPAAPAEGHRARWRAGGSLDLARDYMRALPYEWRYLADRALQAQILARTDPTWLDMLDRTVDAMVSLAGPAAPRL